MASVLAALGVTNTAAPDPSSYDAVKAESSNLGDAKAGLNTLISNISMAVSAAKLANIGGSFVDTLSSLGKEAKNAMNSTMTSAQMAAKTLDIKSRLETAKQQQVEAKQQELVAELQKVRDTISARVSQISSDTSEILIAKYNTLLEAATASLTAAKAGSMTPDSKDFQTVDQLNDTLDDLNTLKDVEDNASFNWTRYMKRVMRYVMYLLFIISIACGILLGGVITSNIFADDYFWGIKLFYFIYGAALFPIPILYATFVSTPYWVSTIIPLKSLVPRTIPKIDPSTVKATKPAAPTPAKSSPIPGMKMPGIQMPGTKAPPTKAPATKAPATKTSGFTMPKFFGGAFDMSIAGMAGKAIGTAAGTAEPDPEVEEVVDTLTTAVATVTEAPVSNLSLMDSFFGYTLVDSKKPTPNQTAYRSELHTISIVEFSLLAIVALYYGLDKTLLKNQL
jgi:hypothetical protein